MMLLNCLFGACRAKQAIHRPSQRPHHEQNNAAIDNEFNSPIIELLPAVEQSYKIKGNDKKDVQGDD